MRAAIIVLVSCCSVFAASTSLKKLPAFDFPECNKKVVVTPEHRWRDGTVDLRLTTKPFVRAIAIVNSTKSELRDLPYQELVMQFRDKEDFVVAAIIPVFDEGRYGQDGSWISDTTYELSKAEFERIATYTITWKFTAVLKEALNQ